MLDEPPAIGTVVTAVALFVATDLDDLVLLSVWFAHRRLSARQIVLGQFLGIGTLVAGSATAAMAAIAIPERWIALLGLVPLGLGLHQAWQLRPSAADDNDDDDAEERERRLEVRTGSPVLAVAAITIANGGDNLAAYVPVFAANLRGIPAFAIAFALMTAIWCALGYGLANHPLFGRHVQRYGHILVPAVLIALGIAILMPLFDEVLR